MADTKAATKRPARAHGRQARRGASADPVFVLCGGRSGSTLLRFVLDAHPDLACPPETNVPTLCGQLANVWSLIEGAPLSANRGDEPPEIPDAAIAGVRETMDRMVGSYLARRGKKRYCDKSLGTASYSYLMTRVWPEAKFICLFRHPMDVIASGMEACPWGLNGYGFDPYIAETPGNAVFALARFWVDTVGPILVTEQQWPERCHRVRYEDMVEDPQAVADALFEFLGVAPVPGIAAKIFARERERFGPADYKIWHTSAISTESVGRGWTVPAGLIGPLVREQMNMFCGKLGYLAISDGWGSADQPAELRVPITPDSEEAEDEAVGAGEPQAAEALERADAQAGDAGTDGAPVAGDASASAVRTRAVIVIDPQVEAAAERFAPELIARLREGVARTGEDFAQRWEPCGAESFMVVATPDGGHGPGARWLVDLAARAVTAVDGYQPAPGQDGEDSQGEEDAEPETAWDMIATVTSWRQMITGQLNLSVALRRHALRYLEQEETGPVVSETRIGMMSDLLGLASWGQAQPHTAKGANKASATGQAA